jgi:hypothetical protein
VSRDGVALTLLALATTAGVPALAAPTPGIVDTARVLALDCNAVDAASVRDVLAHARAPRVILVNGSLPAITLDSFARFLAAMGYPAERLRDPHDGALSISGYTDSARLAGIVAWHYEHDGMAPILIGHSRGGMVVVKTLHELAGAFGSEVAVWDAVRDEPLPRTTVVDPRTDSARSVIGIQVPYAVTLATGKLPRVWQGQWNMIRRLRVIPDTVRDFTGIRIEGDLIAGDFFGPDPYVSVHTAHVRNVTLPASYSHLDAPNVEHLAADPATRAWIESFRPDRETAAPVAKDSSNLLHAAEIWYGVRRAWCLEAQALQAGGRP